MLRTKIFISYRRKDSLREASDIHNALALEFGKDSVFKDEAKIEPGEKFKKVIDNALDDCKVLLAIVGKKWLTETDSDGITRRLDREDDFVRMEIEKALDRGIPIVPVLLDGVDVPQKIQLPAILQPLFDSQSIKIRHASTFESDMARLVTRVARYIGHHVTTDKWGKVCVFDESAGTRVWIYPIDDNDIENEPPCKSVLEWPPEIEGLVGRSSEVERAVDLVKDKQSIELYGDSGIGKTAILSYLSSVLGGKNSYYRDKFGEDFHFDIRFRNGILCKIGTL